MRRRPSSDGNSIDIKSSKRHWPSLAAAALLPEARAADVALSPAIIGNAPLIHDIKRCMAVDAQSCRGVAPNIDQAKCGIAEHAEGISLFLRPLS